MEVSHFMLSKKVSGMLAGNAIRIFCDNVTCFETKKAPGRLPLHSDCVENTEARFALVRWLIRSTQIWNHRSTSIVLTNSRLPSPCVATAVLTHPQRYLYTKKLFKTKRVPSRWRYWGAIYQWWHLFQRMSDCTVFTCAGCMRCFFENNSQNDCLLEVFRRAPNLQEHPTCEKHRLFNDGGVLYIIFYCLDIYESLDRMWIWINIVDSDILGWACCLHIFIQKP